MALKYVILLSVALASASAQSNLFRVCATSASQCQSLDLGDSQATCSQVESRVDCALQLARGTADIGYFTDEELFVLADLQPNDHRVVASIRDITRQDPVSFEAVAIVPNTHTNGLQGLRSGKYCHPGLGENTFRWSPRVEKTLEAAAAGTTTCPGADSAFKTPEEMEAAALATFFGDSCRPGTWSANSTHDDELKLKYPSLCTLCGPSSSCNYTIDMGVNIGGVNNNNAHIKALECLRTGGSVAYVAWQHVKEFFTIRNPTAAGNFSLLCPDNTLAPLTAANLAGVTAPCAFVRQPWSAIVATASRATEVQTALRSWWPNQVNPNDNSWRSTVFSMLVPSWSSARVNFEDTLLAPANYTASIRTVPSIPSAPGCVPPRSWCTTSDAEFRKCQWVRSAAFVLGIQPTIECQQRVSVFDCLRSVKDNNVDFVVTGANYGYLARQRYSLSPVKLMQNHRSNVNSFSRVVALVRNATEVTRFENLKGKKACFPEFGGISYMSFVRTAQEVGVLSATECDYARAVGEFFESSCAPGALDAMHALSEASSPSYDATPLCTACRSTNTSSNFTCDWNHANNLYFGNNGSLSCLVNSDVQVAFVDTQNLTSYMTAMNINPNQFRVLCRNNTLAVNTGINVEEACMLAYVVDSEVLTRRNDPAYNSISTLLETLEKYFGYTASSGTQHINLEIFSSFDGTRDLLFKDTAVGFSEPTSTTTNEQARNYFELFRHLQACTGAGSNIPVPGLANRSFYSIVTLIVSALLTRFIVY